MKLMTRTLTCTCVMLMGLGYFPANATTPATTPATPPPPFTLRIPLEVDKLHERIHSLFIKCQINAPRGLYETTGFSTWAQHFVNVDRATGLPVEAVAVVPVVLPAGKDPRSVMNYSCEMKIIIDSSPVTPTAMPASGMTYPSHYDSSKSFQANIRGQIGTQ